ncbi:MAG TPA: hypothetical protein RMH99_27785 [Sandaracinaceae bacterium LLY-WYZ-13_1]|nr:hypothetical protein [Sandaracinaceae bacterium LLY-WYZ-13_1]
MSDEGQRDAYRRFASIWANGEAIRSEPELEAAIRAAGKDGDAPVTDEWLRSLRRAWVYGDSDDPFENERANRSYRSHLRELSQ